MGTRGSDLALWQTRWVCAKLREHHPSLEIETIVIKTPGDANATGSFGKDWPVGAFVSAIESALLEEQVDFAVHSYKDMQTAQTKGLMIAAVPKREVTNDVLLTDRPVELDAIPTGFRVGTSSPRRIAQLQQLDNIECVPIRGNLPTRVGKIGKDGLNGVVLAAAGLARLGIEHPHSTQLPVDRFIPAPAQGALAIQTRAAGPEAEVIAVLEHPPSRMAVDAERSFLHAIGAGCHTPVGAIANIEGSSATLTGQLFSDDFSRMARGQECGENSSEIGQKLARRLISELEA